MCVCKQTRVSSKSDDQMFEEIARKKEIEFHAMHHVKWKFLVTSRGNENRSSKLYCVRNEDNKGSL